MHFAVDGTLWEGFRPDLYDQMAGEILRGLTEKGLHFTLLGKTAPASPPLSLSSGSLPWKQVEEKVADRLRRNAWSRKTVPRAMKEGKMERWISWEGLGLEDNLPQWIFLKEVSDLLWPGPEGASKTSGRKFRARWEKVFGHPSTHILTFSARAAGILKESYGVPENRVHVVPAFYKSGYSVASWEDRELTKRNHSGGKEYFLWTGSLGAASRWVEVLKAFSMFKKRQKSHMQMLMAPFEKPGPDFLASLNSYKYRDEVHIIDPAVFHWQEILRSAYAVLYLPDHDELGWLPGMTMELEVPLISTADSIGREWAENAVLWVQSSSPESVSGAMMQVYKDETFRSQLIEEGRLIAGTRTSALLISQYEQVLTSTPDQ